MMRIALCSYSPKEAETSILMQIGDVIRFDRGSFVAYAIHSGKQYDIAIVMEDEARGMNDCMVIREHDRDIPIIWISDQEEFRAQSVRMHVNRFFVKPISPKQLTIEVMKLMNE